MNTAADCVDFMHHVIFNFCVQNDLAEENRRLEAHVKQLRCIIAKLQAETADRTKKKGKQKEQRPFDFSK